VNAAPAGSNALVQVRDLKKTFDVSKPWLERVIERAPKQFLKAVDGVSFEIRKGETFALVGESGSGKSTVARMVVGLLPATGGEVTVDGISMTDPGASAAREKLRRRIQMIFQDPYASLNPRWRVQDIIAEPIRAFGLLQSTKDVTDRVGELLTLVGLSPLDGVKFPHQFSGGQRQRIAIARALASNAEFIVCDEPTSALDVSVQAQILNLMRDLQDRMGLTSSATISRWSATWRAPSASCISAAWPKCRRRRRCSAIRAIPIRGCCWTPCRTSACPAARAYPCRARSRRPSTRPRAAPSIRDAR
jgi:peptide/nickel transport system ATP-binding protein